MCAPNAIKWLDLMNIWFQCYNFILYRQYRPRFRDWTYVDQHTSSTGPAHTVLSWQFNDYNAFSLQAVTACLNDVAEQPLKWCTAADTWQCRLRIFYNSPLPIIFSFNFTSLFVILWSLDHLRDCLIIWIICDCLSSLFL